MAGSILNAAKWSSRAGAAASDYATGVKSTTKDWAGNTAAAQTSYEQGIQDSIGRKAFSKGVTKAGTAKWQTNASNMGAARYPQGVANAQQAYSGRFLALCEQAVEYAVSAARTARAARRTCSVYSLSRMPCTASKRPAPNPPGATTAFDL